jgi:phosphate/sulfate permease
MVNTVLAWIGSLAVAMGLSYGIFAVLDRLVLG